MLMVIYSRCCLFAWSTSGGTLDLRAKTWVCLNKISNNKHHCAVHITRTKYK